MAESSTTEVQEAPGVSTKAIVISVALVFLTAAAVLAIIAAAFWIKLGILPTNMAGVGKSNFPDPQLQVEPLRDLAANEMRGRRRLARAGDVPASAQEAGGTQPGGLPIEAAMAFVAARPDPYAPLLDEREVQDSAGLRAMIARRDARSGGAASLRSEASRGMATAGARTGAMAPPAERAEPSNVPGLAGETSRVPAGSLQGTPTYEGTRNTGAVTR